MRLSANRAKRFCNIVGRDAHIPPFAINFSAVCGYGHNPYADDIIKHKTQNGYLIFVRRDVGIPPYNKIKDLFKFGQPQGLSLPGWGAFSDKL